MYEEILMEEEGLQKTDNSSVFIGKPIEFNDDLFVKQLKELKEVIYQEKDDIKQYIHNIVPTYQPWIKK